MERSEAWSIRNQGFLHILCMYRSGSVQTVELTLFWSSLQECFSAMKAPASRGVFFVIFCVGSGGATLVEVYWRQLPIEGHCRDFLLLWTNVFTRRDPMF